MTKLKSWFEWMYKGCPKCGAPNPDSYPVCANCGTPL